ncbi:RES family NAD+ phosphorylase [Pseudovibrio sp. WM33]|uniref:RES family NAD+ phosphorylase n=1 Tax=Pseudovibrio sp. WM33 TaxID=1735585 RepID=UPI0007AE3C77|nr:RES family NAD+ phosphorylase [Pseudovibrio sp. WM33]KZL23327.1 RES domain protein [Pseudovibrio sp. WM33]
MTLVCPDCFGDAGLQRRIKDIRPAYQNTRCDFHPSKKGIPISAVAGIVDQVFRNQYTFGDYHPIYDDFVGDDLHGVLYGLTEADDGEVVAALADALIEGDDYWSPDGEDAFYTLNGSYVQYEANYEEHSLTWRHFQREILHEQRFFSQSALLRLQTIFDGLHLLRDGGNGPVVYRLENGDKTVQIHRARIANRIEEREQIARSPASQLGPPPEKLRRAGRMNPSGILAFYGAFDLDTCVAELRPAVGETVIAAKFELTRPILVLDTTKFTGRPKAINVFAPTYVTRMRLWKFMTTFMNEIARPCLPDDEHLDYIPTQVVSEYLTHLHKLKIGGEEKTIEAIIYRSAQNGNGKNIAIFGKAATVKDAGSRPKSFLSIENPAIEVVEGSISSHEVSRVRHAKQKVHSTVPKPESLYDGKDDELLF